MKWYPHDPSAALAGMIGLTVEERGAYYTLIDLLYARDGQKVRDELVCHALECNPRTWRAIKKRLIDKGKIWETATGDLMAKRVEWTLNAARNFSERQSKRARIGWQHKQNQPLKNANSGNAKTTTSTTTKKKEGRKRESSARATPLPENWYPSCFPPEDHRMFDEMRDWCLSKDRTNNDWEAFARNWKRREAQFNGAQNNGNGRRQGSVLAAFDRLGEKLKAAGATDDYVPGSSGPRPLELDPKVRPTGFKLVPKG